MFSSSSLSLSQPVRPTRCPFIFLTSVSKPNQESYLTVYLFRNSCCPQPTILEEAEYIIEDTDKEPELDPDSIYEQVNICYQERQLFPKVV